MRLAKSTLGHPQHQHRLNGETKIRKGGEIKQRAGERKICTCKGRVKEAKVLEGFSSLVSLLQIQRCVTMVTIAIVITR